MRSATAGRPTPCRPPAWPRASPSSSRSSVTVCSASVRTPASEWGGAPEQVVRPGAMRRDRGVGVDRVAERRPGGDWGGAAGHPMRCGDGRVERGERRSEAVALASEQALARREVEDARHEVVVARALLEPAHEVGDRDVELARVHDRRVDEQAAHVAADRLRLAGRHAEQHLELDRAGHTALAGQQPRVRHVEEVVAGDAELHRVGALGVSAQSSTRL